MLQFHYSDASNVVPIIRVFANNQHQLSARELEVLKLINLSNDMISIKINRSLDTVKNHVRNIRKKLKLQGSPRSELLAYAIRLYGWEAVMSA